MSRKTEASTFQNMLDHLPKIRDPELESELLLRAYFAKEIPKLTPNDIDDARGKRRRRDNSKCNCCADNQCGTQQESKDKTSV